MKHLLSIEELGTDGILELLTLAESFVDSPKVDSLKGKSIVNLFFEDSTRTRVSFELAGKLLSADVINFGAGGSSLNKGESLRDTVQTISAMGFDAMVVRHKSAGVPWQMTQWTDAAIINAGDGAHQHPTQGLLDALTLSQQLGRKNFDGTRIVIVGDIAHSRVVRSLIDVFNALGGEVTLVGPPTLMPPNMSDWKVNVAHDLDEVVTKCDVIYTIRPQRERIKEALIPSMDEYITRYGISNDRFSRLDEHVVIMEAGPLVRGVQMSNAVADNARNLMNKQVTNGVAVRMAVLERLLSSPVTPAHPNVTPAKAGALSPKDESAQ